MARRLPPSVDPEKPFNDLPGLPPKAELETPVVLRACIRARAALGELNAAAELVPNPAILVNTIPILEARASSEIENIITTTEDLFRFGGDEEDRPSPATKEAWRYREALKHGAQLLETRPLGVNLAIDVCTILRGIDTRIRQIPGTALRNVATERAVYTPPEGLERLRRLLANWERFLHHQEQLDPLVRMAVGHYQFEAIHPFDDGNGRTGRILNLLFLMEQGLLRHPVLYISGAIIRRKADYYRLLSEVTTTGAWEAWLVYVLTLVEETSRRTIAKIRAMRDLLTEAIARIRQMAPRIYSHELAILIFTHPYCRIADVVEQRIAKRQTASEYLATLVDIGVLEPIQRNRSTVFAHRALLRLLASETNEYPPYRPPSGGVRTATKMGTNVRPTEKKMRFHSIDEQLRFAVANKRLIEVTYSGASRIVEPHDYGVHKDVTRLLAYQLRQSGISGRKILSGWRLVDVSKIEKCDVLTTTFAGSRGGAHEHHYVWDPLYARVT
jgi:Fic family protein